LVDREYRLHVQFDASGAWTTGQNWGGTGTGTSGTAVVNGGNLSVTTGGGTSYTFTFQRQHAGLLGHRSGHGRPLDAHQCQSDHGHHDHDQPDMGGSARAASYTVYRSTSSSGTYTSVGTATTTNYTDTGLSSATTYYYKLTATIPKAPRPSRPS